MRPSKCSAPGKLILFGEHAVVYGHLAIATCLSDLRICASATPLEDGIVEFVVPDLAESKGEPLVRTFSVAKVREAVGKLLPADGTWDKPAQATPEVLAAIGDLLTDGRGLGDDVNARAVLPIAFLTFAICQASLNLSGAADATTSGGIRVKIESATLPVGAGIGSSAALCVAIAGALVWAVAPSVEFADSHACRGAGMLGHAPSRPLKEIINEWAFRGETIIHGNPSGLDNTMSCFGGALAYSRTNNMRREIEHFPPLQILLTNTKVPKNTGVLVAGVRARREAYPAIIDPILQAIHNLAETCSKMITEMLADPASHTPRDIHNKFGVLMDINHNLLCALGVGHPALDVVAAASRAYGFHCKLTGAGGGGCAMSLLSEDDIETTKVDEFAAKMAANGFESFQSAIGGPGVLIHDE